MYKQLHNLLHKKHDWNKNRKEMKKKHKNTKQEYEKTFSFGIRIEWRSYKSKSIQCAIETVFAIKIHLACGARDCSALCFGTLCDFVHFHRLFFRLFTTFRLLTARWVTAIVRICFFIRCSSLKTFCKHSVQLNRTKSLFFRFNKFSLRLYKWKVDYENKLYFRHLFTL